MNKAHPFIGGERVRKASTVERIEPMYEDLATGLSAIPELRYIKLFPQRLSASNVLSTDGKKNPVVKVGTKGIVAVELLIRCATCRRQARVAWSDARPSEQEVRLDLLYGRR